MQNPSAESRSMYACFGNTYKTYANGRGLPARYDWTAPATKSGFHLPDGPMVQGPKFRVGELAGEPVELKNGEVFEFGVLDL